VKNLILIWALLLPYLALGQATNSDTQYRNDGETLVNGSFEQGKKGYTFTVGSGSTVWSAQSTTKLTGRAMQLTLSAQTFSFKSATTQGVSLQNQNGYIEVYLSASLSGAEFCPVVDGVSAPTTTPNECQPIIAGVGFKPYGIQKTFGVSSLNYEIRGVSNASYTGVIYADDGSVAKTSKVQNELISYSNVISNTITIGATTTAPTKGTTLVDRIVHSRIGSRLIADYQFEMSSAGGSGSGDYLYSLPSGLSFDSSIIPYSGVGAPLAIAEAKAIVGYGEWTDGANTVSSIKLIAYSATQFRMLANIGAASKDFANSAYLNFSANIGFGYRVDAPISGWSNSNIKFLNQPSGGWLIDVNIGGANASYTTVRSSYTEMSGLSWDMVINTSKGSATAEIPCQSTTASTGLTCGGGFDESLGVVFTPPKTGKYRVCVFGAVSLGGGGGNGIFQLIETPNNAQTILQEGGSRINIQSSSTSLEQSISHCSNFTFNDTAKKTIRLMHEKSSTVTMIPLTDRDVNSGQRDFHFTIEPVVENIQASLQGYTSVNGIINPKIKIARYTAGGCANIVGIGESWITLNSGTNLGTQCAWNISGFAVAPLCFITPDNQNAMANKGSSPTTVSVLQMRVLNSSTFASLDTSADILCIGY
jgi:hypothetical protein